MPSLCSHLFNNIVLSKTPDPWCSWKVWSGGWIDRTREVNQTRGLPPEVGKARASRCWTFSSQVKVHWLGIGAWSRNILPANKMIAKLHWGGSADLEVIRYEHCLSSHLPSFKRVHSDRQVVIHSEYPRAPVATGEGKKHSWNKWKPTWSALVEVLDLASQLFHIPMQDLEQIIICMTQYIHLPRQVGWPLSTCPVDGSHRRETVFLLKLLFNGIFLSQPLDHACPLLPTWRCGSFS